MLSSSQSNFTLLVFFAFIPTDRACNASHEGTRSVLAPSHSRIHGAISRILQLSGIYLPTISGRQGCTSSSRSAKLGKECTVNIINPDKRGQRNGSSSFMANPKMYLRYCEHVAGQNYKHKQARLIEQQTLNIIISKYCFSQTRLFNS